MPAETPQEPRCPQCNKTLHEVEPGEHCTLNTDQFDSMRAGDWYCDWCPPNDRGESNRYCYWWDREVKIAKSVGISLSDAELDRIDRENQPNKDHASMYDLRRLLHDNRRLREAEAAARAESHLVPPDVLPQLRAITHAARPFADVAKSIVEAIGDVPDDWPIPTYWNFTAGQLRLLSRAVDDSLPAQLEPQQRIELEVIRDSYATAPRSKRRKGKD